WLVRHIVGPVSHRCGAAAQQQYRDGPGRTTNQLHGNPLRFVLLIASLQLFDHMRPSRRLAITTLVRASKVSGLSAIGHKPSFAVLTQISRNQTVRWTSESFLAACFVNVQAVRNVGRPCLPIDMNSSISRRRVVPLDQYKICPLFVV